MTEHTDDTDDSIDDDEHVSDLFSLTPGDEVTLTMADGTTVDATYREMAEYHDERGVNITHQRTVKFERDDGASLSAAVTDGLSGTAGESPFPSFFPLHVIDNVEPGRQVPDEDVIGFVHEVEQRGA
jgi:hypothetical protein